MVRAFGWSVQPKKETEFFYEIVLRTMKQRQDSGVRRNDLIDMMMDAIRGDIAGTQSFKFILLKTGTSIPAQLILELLPKRERAVTF